MRNRFFLRRRRRRHRRRAKHEERKKKTNGDLAPLLVDRSLFSPPQGRAEVRLQADERKRGSRGDAEGAKEGGAMRHTKEERTSLGAPKKKTNSPPRFAPKIENDSPSPSRRGLGRAALSAGGSDVRDILRLNDGRHFEECCGEKKSKKKKREKVFFLLLLLALSLSLSRSPQQKKKKQKVIKTNRNRRVREIFNSTFFLKKCSPVSSLEAVRSKTCCGRSGSLASATMERRRRG